MFWWEKISKIILGFDPPNFKLQLEYCRQQSIEIIKNLSECADWLINAKILMQKKMIASRAYFFVKN